MLSGRSIGGGELPPAVNGIGPGTSLATYAQLRISMFFVEFHRIFRRISSQKSSSLTGFRLIHPTEPFLIYVTIYIV